VSTVLVAGGATGIGAEAVRALRRRGDSVLLADVNETAGLSVIQEPLDGLAAFLQCDLARAEAADEAVEAAVRLGQGSLDAVFYNAAVLEARSLEDWSPALWERSIAVNLSSPFHVTRAAAPHLRKAEHGRVLMTASTGAFRGHAGMPAYHATKAGIVGLVRALADELGPDGVTVNALCPGWVDTPFNDSFWAHQDDPSLALSQLLGKIPLRRQAEPAEIADLVLFILSDASAYITGQALVIDGGYTAV
jgi:NAD(P)-dependent dehydrogenase (short-subunit alcohol dehydrogenase family)